MEIIKVYYSDYSDDPKLKTFEFAVSSWYCKPAILSSLAVKLDCLFLTCTKYGDRKFLPSWFYSYPVHGVAVYPYKSSLNWVVLEFNDHADDQSWSFSVIRSLYEEKSMYQC